MQKKIIFAYSLISILLIVNIYEVSQIKQHRKANKELSEKLRFNNELIELHKKNIVMQIEAEGIALNFGKITSENNIDLITLESFLKKSDNILVIRYSQMNCQTCVDDQLKVLKQILPENILENIVLLAKYNSTKNMYQFKRLNQIKAPIFKLDEDITPIDNLNIPYFFCVNKEGIIGKVFIPSKVNPEFTKEYLKQVVDLL